MRIGGDYGKEKLPEGQIFMILKCFVPFLSVFSLFLCYDLRKMRGFL